MSQKLWAPIIIGVIAVIALLGTVAVAIHKDPAQPRNLSAGGPSSTLGSSATGASDATTTPSSTATGPNAVPGAAGGPPTTTPTATATAAPTTTIRPAATGTTVPSIVVTEAGPTRAGTYTFNHGPGGGTSRLIVSPPSGNTQSSVRDDGSNPTTTVVVFNASGVYTQSLTVPGINVTCAFPSPGVAWPPWPLATGAAFSGRATCEGQGLSATLSVNGKVLGPVTGSVGGAAVATFLVTTAITITGTGIAITATQDDLYAPSLRLAIKTVTKARGNIFGTPVSTNDSYDLASATPS